MKHAGKPLLLMILDGWGMPEHGEADAFDCAKIPVYDRLWANFPHTILGAAGEYVGLPKSQMGDSEVGHMNIGAGRVIYQDYTHINKQIEDGDFFEQPTLLKACQNCLQNNSALHLIGLVSDGGIHSHINHLMALIELAHRQKISKVFVHFFSDGRDTGNAVALEYVRPLEALMAKLNTGQIASVIGRFYAMDRDKRWSRVQKAYRAMVYGDGIKVANATEAITSSYAEKISDEFIKPHVIVDQNQEPIGLIKENDSLIFFNFRSDRARELSHAFADKRFEFFDRGEGWPRTFFVTLTGYDDTLQNVHIAYPPHPPVNTLGRVLSRNGLRQLRIAETEKYAHVTFFFNGGIEQMEVGEDRVMIPSPNVKTYDLTPQMSADAVTRAVIDRIESGIYDVIILNYANPDMIGHTGNVEATVECLNYIDSCIARIYQAIQEVGGTLLVTADHGNVERMMLNGEPMTSHTTNMVPFIIVDDELRHLQLREGCLEDIAPTILHLLGIALPPEMTGRSLIEAGLQQFDQLSLF